MESSTSRERIAQANLPSSSGKRSAKPIDELEVDESHFERQRFIVLASSGYLALAGLECWGSSH
jgi:hypothetical protein